jgi:hypothetical protein
MFGAAELGAQLAGKKPTHFLPISRTSILPSSAVVSSLSIFSTPLLKSHQTQGFLKPRP